MIDLTLEDLKQLLFVCRRARQYAWEHYEELAVREAAHILYGPYAYHTGAAVPWSDTPKKARNLSLKTRRKSYLIYELDHEYTPIRIKEIFDSVHRCTHHFFELDGVRYSCPFLPNQREMAYGEGTALGYKDGKPYYAVSFSRSRLYVRFCEYVPQGKALMTEYSYNAVSEYSLHGYPTDFDAPIGALNSAAQRVCWEEEPVYTDFSQFFKKAEESSQP